ncbi:MAG: glutathione S-transferase N-terminal domain-containing protein, partial [Rhodospirillales bacterium]
MIDVYSWDTPNGQKVTICLEECGLGYRLIPVNIRRREQRDPAFLDRFPNGKIPAITDHDPALEKPLEMFESGAILLYLADKSGTLIPAGAEARATTLSWLFWQVSALGPGIGQWGRNAGPDGSESGEAWFRQEVIRLMTLLDQRLAQNDYLAGSDFSIADIACFTWLRRDSIYMRRFPSDSLQAFDATT